MLLGIILSAVATIRNRQPKPRRDDRDHGTAGAGSAPDVERAEIAESVFCKVELDRGLTALAAYHARRHLVLDRKTGEIIVIEAGAQDRAPVDHGRAGDPVESGTGGWSPRYAVQ